MTIAADPLTAANLVARRRALGLSQQALGEVLGVPRNTVARWERGALRVERPEWLELALNNFEARSRGQPPNESSDESPAGDRAVHLPAELSSFVGRDDEVAACCALLTHERLITLTGPGGIGKSRLAVKVARCAADSFPNGVYAVDLGTLQHPANVARAVATALNLAERSGDSLTEVLIETLRPQKTLLLMDDCDPQVEACAALADRLLRGAPRLAILATCRERLDVRGEIVWRVPALTLPAADADYDAIARSEAVRLFVERAQLVAPWFNLTEASAPGIARLCRRLDGIPLALELAAARMKALSLEQLEARLLHTFELLSRGSRTAPSRQQTLRATVDWSYSLLTESERALFRRLSVFAGGWSLESAERVTSGELLTPDDTLYLLERLIDKSLVVSEERQGAVRQSMLDTLREYAHERLVEAGEEQQVRRRHFEWVLESARSVNPEQMDPRLRTADGLEVHNLRSALGWSIEAGEAELGLQLASAVGLVWSYRGHFAEGICWLEKLLKQPSVADLPRCRGRALKWIGVLNYGLGNMSAAQASIKESYRLLAGQVDEQDPPVCTHLLGNIARARGDLAGAAQLYEKTLGAYRQKGLRFWEAVTLFVVGSVLFEQGDFAGSRTACERCLALGRGRDFPWATSRARVILAYLANHDCDDRAAERYAQDALAEQRAREDAGGIAISLRALSQFALEKGRLGCAWGYLAEALEIARVEGDCMALARTLETVACVLASQGPSQAAQIAGAASTLRTRTGTVPWPSEQARLERWLNIGRQKIGVRAFDAAWALGEAFSESEAISAANRFVAEALASPAPKSEAPSTDGPLTARQREVVALVARGLTNDQIAQALVISPATARAHLEHVLDRLDLHSRAQVAAWAAQQGLYSKSAA